MDIRFFWNLKKSFRLMIIKKIISEKSIYLNTKAEIIIKHQR